MSEPIDKALRRLATVCVVACVCVGMPAAAQVSAPKQDEAPVAWDSFEDALDFAQNSYLYGDYGDVVTTLAPVLLPEAPDGVSDPTLVRAYTLLGTAAHFEDEGPIADDAFLEVLLRDPRFQLDPLLYPPRVIERFERVRETNAHRLEALTEERDLGSVVYIQREVREQSRLVSMLPFGYGFFTSDRELAGFGYAVSEGALGATMFGLFLSNEFARGRDGFFAEPERARNRATAQLVVSSAFTALVIVNMVHGAVTHDQSMRSQYRVLDEPPADFEDGPSGVSRRRGWRFSFAPIFPSP